MTLRRNSDPIILLTSLIALSVGACGGHAPTTPYNLKPVILSLTVSPTTITPSDSALVVCDARDADGDPLVYDWVTDSRLRIQGALANDYALYNTHQNFRVVYPYNVAAPIDTPWIECTARDGRGMSDSRIVRFVVRSSP